MKATTPHPSNELASKYQDLSRKYDALSLAIADVVNGNVTWLTEDDECIGLCSPSRPDGGVVIFFLSEGSPAAAHWEDWFPHWRDYIPGTSDATGGARRSLAHQAAAYIARCGQYAPQPT